MQTIIYATAQGFEATNAENYFARIQNAHEIMKFPREKGFEKAEEVADYLRVWCGKKAEDICIVTFTK